MLKAYEDGNAAPIRGDAWSPLREAAFRRRDQETNRLRRRRLSTEMHEGYQNCRQQEHSCSGREPDSPLLQTTSQ